MEEEQTVVHIDLCDGGTRLAIGRHVRQLVVLPEGLADVGGSHTAGNVVFLAHDVFPNAVNGVDISRVARQGSHIRHTRIHVAGADGVPNCLILLNHRLVSLAVFILTRGISAFVEEKLRLIEVLLVAGNQV